MNQLTDHELLVVFASGYVSALMNTGQHLVDLTKQINKDHQESIILAVKKQLEINRSANPHSSYLPEPQNFKHN